MIFCRGFREVRSFVSYTEIGILLSLCPINGTKILRIFFCEIYYNNTFGRLAKLFLNRTSPNSKLTLIIIRKTSKNYYDEFELLNWLTKIPS